MFFFSFFCVLKLVKLVEMMKFFVNLSLFQHSLRIRIKNAEMLRIQRIWILSTEL